MSIYYGFGPLFLLLLVQLVSIPALAEESDPCAEAETQIELDACALKRYKAADIELNGVYNQVLAKLGIGTEAGDKLKAAQVLWIKFRDADCESTAYTYRGGTIYPLIFTGCLADRTELRVKELRDNYMDP